MAKLKKKKRRLFHLLVGKGGGSCPADNFTGADQQVLD